MARHDYRMTAEHLAISTDEDAPLWRRVMEENKSRIQWQCTEIRTGTARIRIWGWLCNAPRYLISSTLHQVGRSCIEKVELTYWPLRVLDTWERLGIFETVADAKTCAEHDHAMRKHV